MVRQGMGIDHCFMLSPAFAERRFCNQQLWSVTDLGLGLHPPAGVEVVAQT